MNKIIVAVILLIIIILLILKSIFTRDKDTNTFINTNNLNNPLENTKIFIINLEKQKDRKEHMTNLMNKLNFKNFEFVIPVSLEEAQKKQNEYNNLEVKGLSNKLTHIGILEKCVKENIQNFVIAEDDIDIFSDNIKHLDKILKDLQNKNWDLLFLEFCNQISLLTQKINIKTSDFKNIEYYKLKTPFCAGFIVYKLETAKKILNLNLTHNTYYDAELGLHTLYGKLEVYGAKIFKQNHDLFGSFTHSRNYDKYFWV